MLAVLAFAPFVLGLSQTPAPAAVQKNDSLSHEIAQHRAAGETYLPDADHFTYGSRSVAANTRVDGPVAVAHGNLDVYGTVDGDVVALDGDVRVHKGARVTGDAWAADGRVIIDGGLVEGEQRAINAGGAAPAAIPVAPIPSRPLGTLQSIRLVIGWFALLAIIGLGVMIFTEGNLDGVVIALERSFSRSFWIGLGGQVIMLPALLVLVVGLGITVLGLLLIPFAIVAYVIAVAGLVTLGFLSVARLMGGAIAWDRGTTSPRGVHLRALFLGLVVFLGIWIIAAVFTWSPVLGAILRAVAIAITWVAATVGLGATITSRAGTVRPGVGSTAQAAANDFDWQTPTPVSGVAAATRRTTVPSSR